MKHFGTLGKLTSSSFKIWDEIAEKLESPARWASGARQVLKTQSLWVENTYLYKSEEDQELGKKYTYQSIPAQGKTKGY